MRARARGDRHRASRTTPRTPRLQLSTQTLTTSQQLCASGRHYHVNGGGPAPHGGESRAGRVTREYTWTRRQPPRERNQRQSAQAHDNEAHVRLALKVRFQGEPWVGMHALILSSEKSALFFKAAFEGEGDERTHR